MLSMSRFLPHEKSSTEGIIVITPAAMWRQLLKPADITASDNHVLKLKG